MEFNDANINYKQLEDVSEYIYEYIGKLEESRKYIQSKKTLNKIDSTIFVFWTINNMIHNFYKDTLKVIKPEKYNENMQVYNEQMRDDIDKIRESLKNTINTYKDTLEIKKSVIKDLFTSKNKITKCEENYKKFEEIWTYINTAKTKLLFQDNLLDKIKKEKIIKFYKIDNRYFFELNREYNDYKNYRELRMDTINKCMDSVLTSLALVNKDNFIEKQTLDVHTDFMENKFI